MRNIIEIKNKRLKHEKTTKLMLCGYVEHKIT